MDTNQKGDIAELSIAAQLVKVGYQVLKPLRASARYDLVIEIDGEFKRVQCKWGTVRNGVVTARLVSNSYNHRGELTQSKYNSDCIDFICIYCMELDRCYLVPVGTISDMTMVSLRIDPPKNNQREGVRLADDYRIRSLGT